MKRNLLLHVYARPVTLVALAAICLGFGPLVHAQEAKPGGSPLDTLMHTKIWADVPEAKDFVRTGLVLTVIALGLVMLLGVTYWRWLGYV